jgi:hypothetical protein
MILFLGMSILFPIDIRIYLVGEASFWLQSRPVFLYQAVEYILNAGFPDASISNSLSLISISATGI